jgi:peptidoglycan/LPS O-acetylase OafA/YrhL
MLQRKQTIWLLLAAASSFLTLKFPFYSGVTTGDNLLKTITGTSNYIILALTVALLAGILISIFLFKNRKLQLRITIAGIFVSLLNLVLYYLQAKNFTEGNYAFTAILSLIIPVLLILAARGIYKDEKLVKSLDRLR